MFLKFSASETKRVTLKTVVNIDGNLPPDLRTARLGARIRYIRRRLGISYMEFARRAGVSHTALTRLERGEGKAVDMVLSRVVRALGPALAEAFPGTPDVFDLLFPPEGLGGRLRNFRLRRGLQQKELAKALGVSKASVCRYEKGLCRPGRAVRILLAGKFGLDECYLI